MIEHNFLELASKAFIDYLDQMMKPYESIIGQELPIAINNTGDEVFLTNKFGGSMDRPQLYTSTPRLVLDVKGITIQSDQLTSFGHLGKLVVQNEDGFKTAKRIPLRRIPLNFTYDCEMIFNNIFEYLTFIEVFLTISHHNHVFEFYYQGASYSATFFLPEDFDSSTNLELSYTTDRRHRRLPLTFVLQLQYPAYDIYRIGNHLGDGGFNASDRMNKLIHNMHVDDFPPPAGLVSTIEIT